MRPLKLRTRWIVTTAALVSATGALAVIVTTIITQHLLQDRSRTLFAPPPAPAGAVAPGAPLPPTPARLQAQAAAGHAVTTGVIHDVRVDGAVLVAVLVVLSVVAAWFITSRMLRPVQRIAGTARSVTTTGEGRRIGATGPDDELRELADTIDSMLDRLDASAEAQRRFVADASHELRTPLAAMAVELDVALDNPHADRAELEDALRATRQAVRRAEQLVESLLLLARAGAVQHAEPCRLDESCTRAIDTTRAVHPDLHVDAELEPAPVTGEPVLIDRLVANLVENAARYRTPGTPVSVASGTRDGRAWLLVTNEGRAVDDHEVASWFDRFRRGDRGRASADGGAGLGLAIVKTVADAHGARVHATARREGGITVEIDFARA